MRIEGIAFKPASKKMSNDDVLAEVRRLSEPVFEDDLDKALVSIKYTLDQTQIRTRHWFDVDERPLDLICTVAREALARASLAAGDIDLLIYAGIGRGFLEPGDAYFVANALGMNEVDCFDIMDACMSWTRACDMAQSFFAAKRYKRILIVNCESYYVPGGISYPSNFELKRMREIAYCFSAYCGGDGA
ncbi:MAG: 3-oxoacyl-ACP reductase, partial [Gammaproteobacteria bacterium]